MPRKNSLIVNIGSDLWTEIRSKLTSDPVNVFVIEGYKRRISLFAAVIWGFVEKIIQQIFVDIIVAVLDKIVDIFAEFVKKKRSRKYLLDRHRPNIGIKNDVLFEYY